MTEHEATPKSDADRHTTEGGSTDDGSPGAPPSVRIVEAVAAETGRDAIELPPLHDYVDSDAVDSLLATDANADASLHLEFSYADALVTVRGDGSVEVEP